MKDMGNLYKYIDNCSGQFYNPKKLLTYGRPWNFIAGSRSIGKSTGIAILFILDFIVNGHKFIYCRRTKDELMVTCRTFFGNAVSIINAKTPFKIEDFKYDRGEYKIKLAGDPEVKVCGTIIPLSLEQKYKSSNFSEYYNLVYDEFIASVSTGYLGNANTPEREYNAVLSLYQTIDRGVDKAYRNETRFFFLGNTATIYNPLFLKLNICEYIETEAVYIAPKNQLWILERRDQVEATKEMDQSFAFMLSDDYNRNYAYKNIGADSETFIRKPDIASYIGTFTLKGEDYGIYRDSEWNFYVSSAKPGYKSISLDVDSHNGNDLMLIQKWTDYPMMGLLTEAYKRGTLYFSNGKIQNSLLKYLKFLPA